MTDVRPSPEMLDAMAANRREAQAPLEERDLDQAIAMHRLLYKTETGILKLHQRDGESGIGPPFHPVFIAFLDGEYWGQPWNGALMFLRWSVCRKTHTKHWEREVWAGSLCYELVSRMIRSEPASSLDMVRLALGLSEEGKTRRTLDSALLTIERRIETQLADDKARQSQPARTPAEWMADAHVHRALPGLHAVDCAQCIKRRAA